MVNDLNKFTFNALSLRAQRSNLMGLRSLFRAQRGIPFDLTFGNDPSLFWTASSEFASALPRNHYRFSQ